MLYPAALSAASTPAPTPVPEPAPAPAPSAPAIGFANFWFSLDDVEDEDHDQDDSGWNDNYDYAAHPDALNPYLAQPLVYPSDDSDDKEFKALIAGVTNVKGMDAWLD